MAYVYLGKIFRRLWQKGMNCVHIADITNIIIISLASLNILLRRTISILQACRDPAGGFAGGPGQVSHLAATYAACMA